MTSVSSFTESTPPSTSTLRIVMADDDRNEHLLMAMAAEQADRPVQLDFVDDGALLMLELAACEQIDELPDAIILDLRMPRLDGRRTLDELQQHPVLWQVPVVVFTSSTRSEDQMVCFERGAFRFETKPGTFDGMVDFFNRMADIATDRSIRKAPQQDAAGELLSILSADIVADIEDRIVGLDETK